MAFLRYDTHVHTAEVSSCARVKAGDVVTEYRRAGYRGIMITDHYYEGFFQRNAGVQWKEKIDNYLQGYRNALEKGGELGVDVFLGMELRFTENMNDYLVYGFDEDFLYDNPELYKLDLKKFRKKTEEYAILIYQAHPFRPGLIPADPNLLDGIEVFNGNPRHNSRNELAMAYAMEHRLGTISGSDYHQVEDIAKGGMICAHRLANGTELIRRLRMLTPEELIMTTKVW